MNDKISAGKKLHGEYVDMVSRLIEVSRDTIKWLTDKNIAVPIDGGTEGFFVRPTVQVSSADGDSSIIDWLIDKHRVTSSEFISKYHVVHLNADTPALQRLWFLSPRVEISPFVFDEPEHHPLGKRETEQIYQVISDSIDVSSIPASESAKLIKDLFDIETIEEQINALVEGDEQEGGNSNDEEISDEEIEELLDTLPTCTDEEGEEAQLESAISDVVLLAIREHLMPV